MPPRVYRKQPKNRSLPEPSPDSKAWLVGIMMGLPLGFELVAIAVL